MARRKNDKKRNISLQDVKFALRLLMVISLGIWIFSKLFLVVSALSVVRQQRQHKKQQQPHVRDLQRCITSKEVFQNVACRVNRKNDPFGILSSLVLVRLSKLWIHQDNGGNAIELPTGHGGCESQALKGVIQTLALGDWKQTPKSIEAAVEGTKAASVLLRLLRKNQNQDQNRARDVSIDADILLTSWWERQRDISRLLRPHQLSGLQWSFDCFRHCCSSCSANDDHYSLPPAIQEAYDAAQFPFRIHPGVFEENKALTVSNLEQQVPFRVDDIQTANNPQQLVKERRKTLWQGDDNVRPFEYSGKQMKARPWSPLVEQIRDDLFRLSGHRYDGCLLNLYPDGGSGMRYHIDPDQGKLWAFHTTVVSVGATRRFAFRDIPNTAAGDQKSNQKATQQHLQQSKRQPSKQQQQQKPKKKKQQAQPQPHTFVVMQGDICEMFDDCQFRFQHTVKPAEFKAECATARASLVFKKSIV